ncbi:hypothetical protein D3C79_859630 [compost metagenome]
MGFPRRVEHMGLVDLENRHHNGVEDDPDRYQQLGHHHKPPCPCFSLPGRFSKGQRQFAGMLAPQGARGVFQSCPVSSQPQYSA